MNYFRYFNDSYVGEDVPLATIAENVGTPCYVYSRAMIERHWHVFDAAFEQYPHRICYSVKANSNLAVLDILVRLGSSFDIVSVGELERVLRAGGNPSNVVFSGVGKSDFEIRRALDLGIGCINVESQSELNRVAKVSTELGTIAPIAIRINPDVDPKTHPYIATGLRDNKFGVEIEEAKRMFRQASELKHVEPKGVACHIGSQLLETHPFIDAVEKVADFLDELFDEDIELNHIDIGGGFGIRYQEERPPEPHSYMNAAIKIMERRGWRIPMIIEPGRAIVGNAGVLLTRVEYLKHNDHRNFAVVDAGMNDLLRPALYRGYHDILPVMRASERTSNVYDIVGPVCESSDFLGQNRSLAVAEGDLLVVRSAGAYGFAMSSSYNSRPRPAEVVVDQDHFHIVRKRETLDQLTEGECLLPG